MEDHIKIKVNNLTKIFGKRKNVKKGLKLMKNGHTKDEILDKTKATVGVKQVDLSIEKGEIFVVMGLSGSGKSTLLRCFNRLIEPTEGEILIDGENVLNADKEKLKKIRRNKMSMVFQHFGLLPHRTVVENVAFGLEIQGVEEEKRKTKAKEVISTVGLDGYEFKMTGQLSGGMQQRVGLARALATDPEVLLMDEAFSALDPLIKNNMQDELLDLQNKVHKTILFITHDLDEALKLGDRIAIMKEGEIVQIGTPEEILTSPENDYVKAFVENVFRGKIVSASSIMFENPEHARINKHGPNYIMRKMREIGVNALPVTDNENNFLGFVKDNDVAELIEENSSNIEDIIVKNSPRIKKDKPVKEILPYFVDNETPVAVVDKENKLIGVVVHSSVIGEITDNNPEEVREIGKEGELS